MQGEADMTEQSNDPRLQADAVDHAVEQDAGTKAPEPFVDADDTHEKSEMLDTVRVDIDPAKLGEAIGKAASDTAYATVGLVGLLSDRVREYYEEQKKAYAAEHPDLEEEPNAKHLLSQFSDQLDRFVGDVGRTFRDLVERGRAGAKQAADDVADGSADLADAADDAAHHAADDLGDAAHDLSERVEKAADDASSGIEDAGDQGSQRP